MPAQTGRGNMLVLRLCPRTIPSWHHGLHRYVSASNRFLNQIIQQPYIQISRAHRGHIYLEKSCVPPKILAAQTAQTGDEGTIHVFHSRWISLHVSKLYKPRRFVHQFLTGGYKQNRFFKSGKRLQKIEEIRREICRLPMNLPTHSRLKYWRREIITQPNLPTETTCRPIITQDTAFF